MNLKTTTHLPWALWRPPSGRRPQNKQRGWEHMTTTKTTHNNESIWEHKKHRQDHNKGKGAQRKSKQDQRKARRQHFQLEVHSPWPFKAPNCCLGNDALHSYFVLSYCIWSAQVPNHVMQLRSQPRPQSLPSPLLPYPCDSIEQPIGKSTICPIWQWSTKWFCTFWGAPRMMGHFYTPPSKFHLRSSCEITLSSLFRSHIADLIIGKLQLGHITNIYKIPRGLICLCHVLVMYCKFKKMLIILL